MAEGVAQSEITADKETEPVPTVEWFTYEPDKSYGASVRLPQGFISGSLTVDDKGRYAYIDMFEVDKASQGKGIGTKLLKGLASEVKAYGASTLNGHVTSESALRTRARVFGKENLLFYNHTTGTKLDITYEEALKENPDVNVVVDLTKVDTTTWNRPNRIDANS